MSQENVADSTYGIRIPAAEAASLVKDQGFYQETTKETVPESRKFSEEQSERETEQPTPTEEVQEEKQPDLFTIDGDEYSKESLLAALEDSKNKSEWQKSQTKRDQELAEERKTLKAEMDRYKFLAEDEETRSVLKEFLGEDHQLFKETSVKLDNVESQDTETGEQSTDSNPVEELRNELADIKAERELEIDLNTLQKNFPELEGDNDALTEVLDMAMKKEIPLEDAYKLARFDAAESSAVTKAYKAFKDAHDLKNIPEATGEVKGDHSAPIYKPKSYDDAARHVLDNYDLVTD
jgi:hypothetical protein